LGGSRAIAARGSIGAPKVGGALWCSGTGFMREGREKRCRRMTCHPECNAVSP
jgi:hypothetical protein